MGTFQHIQTNFTAGVLSPRLYGRVDIARYQNGAKTLENGNPLVHGGFLRRPGQRFIVPAKFNNKRARLIPYVFSTTQAYVVEVGDGYMRFFKNTAQILATPGPGAYEIVSPYTEALLPDIDFVQGADTMFIVHESVIPQRLRRFADDNWTIAATPFDPAPFAEIGFQPNVTLTLSLATVGTGRTLTAGAAAFLASDVGRNVTYLGGLATITGYTSTTVVTATIVEAFPSVGPITAGLWTIDSSPQTTCTPSAKDPVGGAVTLTLSAAGWRADDVGKYVRINGGLVKITGYTSDVIVSGVIRQELSATVGAPALAWTLEANVFGGPNGYPRAVTLFEQRLFLAGSPGFPQTVWGSVIAEYVNFELGTLDDDAVSFTIASDQLNPIRHLAQVKTLIALTYGGEFTIQGGVEKPITPTNIQVKNQSVYGCNDVLPVRVGNELMLVQRADRKVRAMSPDRYDSGQYGAPDLAVLAEHITESGIVDMDFIQEPDPILSCLRADGRQADLTIDRDQDVIGWAEQFTDGDIESVAVIPVAGGEQRWVLVRRVIGGVEQRYIEVYDSTLNTDSAIVGASGPGAATWSGLDHLEGKTVDCLADGIDMGQFVVTGGEITLPRTANAVEIGLNYVTRVRVLTPEIPTANGSIQGTQLAVSQVWLLLKDTIGGKVGGDDVQFRQLGDDVLDMAPVPQSGLVDLEQLGWEAGNAEIEIVQDRPYPFHLLAVIRRITSNF